MIFNILQHFLGVYSTFKEDGGDFNDFYFYEITKKNNIPIVTNDGDFQNYCYCKSSVAKKCRVRPLWSPLMRKQHDKCIFTLFWCLFVVFACRVAFASMGDHKGLTLHINFIYYLYC